MDVLPAFLSVHLVCAWRPWRPEVGVRSLGTGVKYDYEWPCGFWESNLVSLEKTTSVLL